MSAFTVEEPGTWAQHHSSRGPTKRDRRVKVGFTRAEVEKLERTRVAAGAPSLSEYLRGLALSADADPTATKREITRLRMWIDSAREKEMRWRRVAKRMGLGEYATPEQALRWVEDRT